jgi:hypothetical protein
VAAYTVAVGEIGKYEIALAANTEDTITFGGGSGDATITDVTAVEVKVLTGTQPVYFCFGTTAATVKGNHCYDAHPGTAVTVQPPTADDTIVRIISAAAATVSVSAA